MLSERLLTFVATGEAPIDAGAPGIAPGGTRTTRGRTKPRSSDRGGRPHDAAHAGGDDARAGTWRWAQVAYDSRTQHGLPRALSSAEAGTRGRGGPAPSAHGAISARAGNGGHGEEAPSIGALNDPICGELHPPFVWYIADNRHAQRR